MSNIEIIQICLTLLVAILDLILNYAMPHEKYEFHIATMIWFWGVMNYFKA